MENDRQSDDALMPETAGKGSEEAFQTILSFAGRATTLAHRQAGSAEANALFMDVVRFCRDKPDYSVLLEPYRRTSEFARFIALLKILKSRCKIIYRWLKEGSRERRKEG